MSSRTTVRQTNERIVRRVTGVHRTPVTTIDTGTPNGTQVASFTGGSVWPGADGRNTFVLDEDALDTDGVLID